jgi:predicted nuclease with TOPRIM domain
MSDESGDVTVNRLILRQLEALTGSVNEQGKVLSSVETTQTYLSRDLSKLSDHVEQISDGFHNLNGKVVALEEASNAKKLKRASLGRIPLPVLHNAIKLLPWLIALGAGVAAAFGLVDPEVLQ